VIGLLAVFVLAAFVGFEVIQKVPRTLHTPLMSATNAISGIAVIGALAIAPAQPQPVGALLVGGAVALATVNVVGGFGVTHRMLGMFRRKE
jgi:H+-translocating NAD(P) transhydrogenase subunit alpha